MSLQSKTIEESGVSELTKGSSGMIGLMYCSKFIVISFLLFYDKNILIPRIRMAQDEAQKSNNSPKAISKN
jgi:hypothetical protein